jgi:hypothetical protein
VCEDIWGIANKNIMSRANFKSTTSLRDKSNWPVFAIWPAFILAFCGGPQGVGYASHSPLLYEDLGDNPNSGDNEHVEVLSLSGATTTIYPIGGETAPPRSGGGQWTPLPNVAYEWHVQGTEGLLSVNDGDITDGDGTTEPSVTAYLGYPGTVNIQVQMRREYQNGSTTQWSDWTPQ